MGRQERYDKAKERARAASKIKQLAHEFHETGNKDAAKRKYDQIVEAAGGQREAENAIRDAGGAGASKLRQWFGR